jgi:hypothetical protein
MPSKCLSRAFLAPQAGGPDTRGFRVLVWKPDLACSGRSAAEREQKFRAETTTISSLCTIMVYNAPMAVSKQIRRSVTLPPQVDKQIEKIAKHRRLSGNRVLVELVELGLEARKQKEKAFFELAERFRGSNDSEEVKLLGDELGRFVFGE